jgi:hypothetical protein
MFYSVLLNVPVLVGVALPRRYSCTLYLVGVAVAVGVAVPHMCRCSVIGVFQRAFHAHAKC